MYIYDVMRCINYTRNCVARIVQSFCHRPGTNSNRVGVAEEGLFFQILKGPIFSAKLTYLMDSCKENFVIRPFPVKSHAFLMRGCCRSGAMDLQIPKFHISGTAGRMKLVDPSF